MSITESRQTATTVTPSIYIDVDGQKGVSPKEELIEKRPTRPKERPTVPNWYSDFEPEDRSWRNIFWLLWWSYGLLRLYHLRWIPTPHHWGMKTHRMRANKAAIWALGPLIFGTYLYRSVKGGIGKTAGATWSGTDVAACSNEEVLVVDLDSGAKAKAARRLGIDMSKVEYNLQKVQTLTSSDKVSLSHTELRRMLPVHTESGAALLAPEGEFEFSAYKTERLLANLAAAYGVFYVDTTPGIHEKNTNGAQALATITTIPCIYGSDDLYHDIRSIRDEMNKKVIGDVGLFDALVNEDRLFVEINGVKKRAFNRRTQYEFAQQLSLKPHQVILMPYEKHVKKDGQVRRNAVSKRFLYAVRERSLTQGMAVAKYNANHPWTGPTQPSKESSTRQRERVASRLIDLHDGSPEDAARTILGVGNSLKR